MKRVLLLFTAVACIQASAQTSKVQEYINQYSDLAIKEMMRTGVPASIILAQGIIETQAGQSSLVANTNNHFGIKCKNDWNGATYLYDDDAKNECFRSYNTAEESYRDHSDFLKNRPHYAFLFKLDATDYEGWAKGLKKAGYATNPAYAKMLINTIVTNQLQQYTIVAIQRMNNKEDLFAINNNTAPQQNRTVTNTSTVTPLFKEEEQQQPEEQNTALAREEPRQNTGIVKVAQTILEAPSYPTGEFTINATRVVYAEAGTSLFALANNNSISFNKLLDYNELSKTDILEKSQLIFLEKKPKKGEKEIHIAALNETLYDICQQEGVSLKNLLEYNRLSSGTQQPAAGEKIYLQKPAAKAPKLAPRNGASETAAY
ncbi:glucosaminidase domain-containing protein [Foetidibacter luteolus]|uniref:glucosaminidase domain-containing protein n=1 Tax=Foetidibacter luteolus TaxID=2608880 RepID=UPI00129A57C2|nr:glucosaminidase domain-containing protein [Foetidibacter luteolus]